MVILTVIGGYLTLTTVIGQADDWGNQEETKQKNAGQKNQSGDW